MVWGASPRPFPFPFSGRTRALKVGTWHLVGNTEAWEHGSWSVCQAFQFLLLQTEAGAGLLLTCSWSVVAICGSKLQEALTIFLGLSSLSLFGQAYVPWACLSVLNSPDNFQPGCGSRRWLWKVFTGGLANDGQQENLPELGDIGLWSAVPLSQSLWPGESFVQCSSVLFETVFIYFANTNLTLGTEEVCKSPSHLAGGGSTGPMPRLWRWYFTRQVLLCFFLQCLPGEVFIIDVLTCAMAHG